MWRNKGRLPYHLVVVTACVHLLSGCGTSIGLYTVDNDSEQKGGIITADEPQSVLIARDILLAGGSAADAATALGFGLAVSLQSSAGLGGGGQCLVYDTSFGAPQALDFKPVTSVGRSDAARWQVATPTLARGLFALHSRYGRLPWAQVIIPAENLAREGIHVSRALANDLEYASGLLANDLQALDTFMSSQRTVAKEGDHLFQHDLAMTLSDIRSQTPSSFYQGALSRLIDQRAADVGASLSRTDLMTYSPEWIDIQPEGLDFGDIYRITMRADSQDSDENRDSVAPKDLKSLASTGSTGFIVADLDGNVVACALTMISPFGAGVLLPESGFILTPSPKNEPNSQQNSRIDMVMDRAGEVAFTSTATGGGHNTSWEILIGDLLTGQVNFAEAVRLENDRSDMVNEPRVNALYCANGLGGDLRQCNVSNDLSGFGFSIIVLDEG